MPRRSSGLFRPDTRYQLYQRRRALPVAAPTGPVIVLAADAITGLNDADPVASWTDGSGNGNTVTQATGAAQPSYQTGELNTLPVVRFDGGDSLAKTTPVGTNVQNFTIFAVVRPTTLVGVERVICAVGDSTGGRVYRFKPTGEQNLIKSDVVDLATGTTQHAVGTAVVLAVTYASSGAINFYKTGNVADGSATPAAANFADGTPVLRVGSHIAGGAEFYIGDIGEIRWFPRILDPTERAAQFAELEAKWIPSGAGASGAAVDGQRTAATSAVAKQAIGVAFGPQHAVGTATDRKQAAGASQTSQRTSGTSTGVKQLTGAAQGPQRAAATAAVRKQAAAAGTGPQHAVGVAAVRKQAIGVALGPQHSSGLVVRGIAAPSGPAVGPTRVIGAAAGIKAATGVSQSPQRVQAASYVTVWPPAWPDAWPAQAAAGSKATSGTAAGTQRTAGAATRIPGGPHSGTQRTSGTTAAKHAAAVANQSATRTSGRSVGAKQVTAATTGPQRAVGVAAKIPTGPARGMLRASGQTAGIKGAAVGVVGPTRTSGQAAEIHGGIGAARGSQHTASTTAAKHGGTTSTQGQTRTSGAAAGSHRTGPVANAGVQHTAGAAGVAKGGRGAAQGVQHLDGVSEFTISPPPRWVEGDSTATGIVEGVLVGAGMVEGSSSL